MNVWAGAVLWGAFQVTILALLGLLVYAVARRRGPETGALAAAGTLLAVFIVTLLAVLPLPISWNVAQLGLSMRGWTRGADAPPSDRTSRAADVSDSRATEPAEGASTAEAKFESEMSVIAAHFWDAFVDEMRHAPQVPAGGTRRWPIVVLTIFLVGVAAGLFRLLAGVTAVSSYRRQSRPVSDPELMRIVQAICTSSGCRRAIEVRQTKRLATPATVGYFKPLVLVPDDWREWSPSELRAVLAHEIAHVARGDYLAGLLAQVTLALHFYHPLVHWLVARMRFEQELAADARGMHAGGGREQYLATLARMALRQDDLSVSWAARPFLPTRGTFIRRIEMLRDAKWQRGGSLSRGGRAVLLGAWGALAIVIAGLRPGGIDEVRAQSPQTAQAPATTRERDATLSRRGDVAQAGSGFPSSQAPGAAGEPEAARLSLNLVPADAPIVFAASPRKLLNRPELAGLKQQLNEQFEPKLGIPVEKLEQVTVALLVNERQRPEGQCVVIRMAEPFDLRSALIRVGDPKQLQEANFAGRSYFRLGDGLDCWMMVDDRTLVVQSEPRMRQAIAALGRMQPHPVIAELWPKVEEAHAALAVASLEHFGRHLETAPATQNWTMTLTPLWRDTRALAIGARLDGELALQGFVNCSHADGAQRVARTLEALRTLFQNSEPNLRKSMAEMPEPVASATLAALNALASLVDSAQLTTNDSQVILSAEGPGNSVALLAVLAPAVSTARQAAYRAQSMNNLRQIALAMHNYHDAFGAFPPPVVIGPDGKTPHSWRVALLPFLEREALYRQYRLDEPWDSPNNQKVLAQMPPVFRHPQAAAGSTTSSYYVLTGESTMFHGSTGCRMQDVPDGTSNTLLVVEAKRDIPWTKPEDIPLDSITGVADLGGFSPEGAVVARGDGSVFVLPNSTAPDALRALATKAGGEPPIAE